MKKSAILIMICTLLLVTGCTKNKPQATTSGSGESKLNCFTLCHETIPEKCADKIVEFEASDVNVMTNDTIYNDEFCEAQCNSWTPEIMACVHSAKDCKQIGPEAEFCMTNEPESPFEEESEVKVDKNCTTACKNYSDCAKYTEGVGPADVADAYNSCMEECAHWNQESIGCMAKAKVSNPADCMAVSMCGLQEYQGLMN